MDRDRAVAESNVGCGHHGDRGASKERELIKALEAAAERMETALSDIKRGDRVDASDACYFGALNARKALANLERT